MYPVFTGITYRRPTTDDIVNGKVNDSVVATNTVGEDRFSADAVASLQKTFERNGVKLSFLKNKFAQEMDELSLVAQEQPQFRNVLKNGVVTPYPIEKSNDNADAHFNTNSMSMSMSKKDTGATPSYKELVRRASMEKMHVETPAGCGIQSVGQTPNTWAGLKDELRRERGQMYASTQGRSGFVDDRAQVSYVSYPETELSAASMSEIQAQALAQSVQSKSKPRMSYQPSSRVASKTRATQRSDFKRGTRLGLGTYASASGATVSGSRSAATTAAPSTSTSANNSKVKPVRAGMRGYNSMKDNHDVDELTQKPVASQMTAMLERYAKLYSGESASGEKVEESGGNISGSNALSTAYRSGEERITTEEEFAA